MKSEAEILDALGRLPLLESLRSALRRAGVVQAWIVGGLLRDLAAGRPLDHLDVDVSLPGSGALAAAEVARAAGGAAFALDESEGAWRVAVSPRVTVDLIPLRAPDLEGDLRGRDFTINAMAADLLGFGGLVDPLGGRTHLERKVLALCGPAVLSEDPARVLRAYRFAFGLGLHFEEGMVARLRSAAAGLPQVAPERRKGELFAVLALPNGSHALRAMADHGVLPHLFPFAEGWRGFDQGDYHAYDLLEHSLRTAEAVEDLAEHPEVLGLPRIELLEDHLGQEVEAGVTRLALLKCAAFLHDVSKPATATTDGHRRRFLGHEAGGGKEARKILSGLRLGRRARCLAQNVVAAHLRLFGLAHQAPPTKAARLRYLRDLGRDVPEGLLLSVADELATGPEPPAREAVSRTARELLSLHWEQLEKRQNPPLLTGRDVLLHLGVPEGPEIGEILRLVGEAEARGEVATPAEALSLAKRISEERLGRP